MSTSLPATDSLTSPAEPPLTIAPPVASPCPECGTPVERRFCPECGERRLEARDLSLWALVREGAEDAVNLDGRFPRTVRDLLVRPGALTRAWVEGRRNRYARPLTLFLTINVAFFLVIANANVLRWPLQGYRDYGSRLGMGSGADMGRLADRRASARGMAREAFARRFDGALRDRQKTSLIVVVPLFAAATGAVLWRHRRPAVQHLVFATHFYAFFLVWFAGGALTLITLVFVASRPVAPLRPLADWLGTEAGLTALIVGGALLYLWASLRRAYALRRGPALIAAVALTAMVATLVLVLRDLMFLITLYTI